MKFAVVDVETTGGSPQAAKIIEIGIVIIENGEIVKTYNQLVNPRVNIPFYITALTGISNEMPVNKPAFETIANHVYNLLEGAVFCAHNVNFDFAFMRIAFKNAGIEYRPEQKLCTVKYTRRVVKGLKSYSLGNLCKRFGIKNENPHRALGDALATAQLLSFVQSLDHSRVINELLKNKGAEFSLPQQLDARQIESLPDTPGIYRFLNKKNDVLYVGKAKNIKKRVRSHFSGIPESTRYQTLFKEVCDISFNLSGTELMASLMEDHEIRQKWPPFNKAQKQNPPAYGVYEYTDLSGRVRLGINRVKNRYPTLQKFHSLYAARTWLFQTVREYKLSPQLAGLPHMSHFDKDVEVHAKRLALCKKHLNEQNEYRIILQEGRKPDEIGFILMAPEGYKGLGFAPSQIDFWSEPSKLLKYLQLKRPGHLADKLIEKLLLNTPQLQILTFSADSFSLPEQDKGWLK